MKKAKLFFMALALMGGVNLAKAGDASSLGSASDTEWTWTSNESNDIYSGSTVTLKGVVVTIGSSSQTDHKWTYNATNGYLPTNTANVSGTGVAGFSVTSPYGTLPNQGGFLKIVPSTSGTLTITISPSGNGTIPNIFVTTSDGSTITAAESTGKQATTNTYSVTAGNTYYFFPEAQTTSNITTYRWYLQSISFTDETAQIAAAKAELNTLITQAKSYHDNSSDANGAQATLASAYGDAETVYNNASASLSAITSAVSTLTAAIQTFVTSGAKPINGTYFDLTSVIKDPECNSNDNWDGSGRVFGTGKHWSGDATRQYFEKNGKGDFGQNRSQTITLPVAGNYLLKTAIYNVSDNASSQVNVGDDLSLRSYNYYGTTGGTIATDGTEWSSVAAGIAAGKSFANSDNGYGWFYNKIYFTAAANASKTIALSQTGNASSGYESGIGGMYLYYYGDQDVNNVALDQTQTTVEGAAGVDATLARTFVVGYNSICLPFAVSNITGVFGTGAKAYTLDAVETDANGDYTLNFTEAGTMDANTPYLLNLSETKTSVDFGTVTIQPTATPQITVGSVNFTGTYMQTTAAEGAYLVNASSQTLAKAKGDNTVKAYRAYITLPAAEGEAKVRFTIDGEATAIEAINAEAISSFLSGKTFDLNGREVKNPVRGLYIVDGKKVLVK